MEDNVQVAVEYQRDTDVEEIVGVEPPVRPIRPDRKTGGKGDLRFGLSILIGSFVLIELATKFH